MYSFVGLYSSKEKTNLCTIFSWLDHNFLRARNYIYNFKNKSEVNLDYVEFKDDGAAGVPNASRDTLATHLKKDHLSKLNLFF